MNLEELYGVYVEVRANEASWEYKAAPVGWQASRLDPWRTESRKPLPANQHRLGTPPATSTPSNQAIPNLGSLFPFPRRALRSLLTSEAMDAMLLYSGCPPNSNFFLPRLVCHAIK